MEGMKKNRARETGAIFQRSLPFGPNPSDLALPLPSKIMTLEVDKWENQCWKSIWLETKNSLVPEFFIINFPIYQAHKWEI